MGSGKFLVGVTAGFFLLILFVGLQAGYINNLVVLRDGTNPLTDNWDAGNFNITSNWLIADQLRLGLIDVYDFPNADGTDNQILITDGNGTLTFGSIPYAGSFVYFLYNRSSDIATYYNMTIVLPMDAQQNFTYNNVANNDVLINFSTIMGYPSITVLPQGLCSLHIHAYESSTETASGRLYFEVYRRTQGGVETLLGTSMFSNLLEASSVYMDLQLSLDNATSFNATDRIVCRIRVAKFGVGTLNVFLEFCGATSAHFSVPSATVSAANFVPYIGATQNLDLGSFNLTTTGGLIGATLNTGQGANELYDMDQNVLKASEVTFSEIIISGLSGDLLVATNSSSVLVSVLNLTDWISGTVDQIGVADDGDGTITISLLGGGASVGGTYGINVEALAAAKTLTANTDEIYQYFTLGGSNRIITLSLVDAVAGDRFVIRHNDAYTLSKYLDIKQGATQLDRIYAGGVKEFIFDGTNWISRGIGTGENDNKRNNLAIGWKANAYRSGVALGYNAIAHYYGVGIGYSVNAYKESVAIGFMAYGRDYGVAIGYLANGNSYGTALGWHADTGDKRYSIAIGLYSRCLRTAETAINIKGKDDSGYKNQVTQGRWAGTTTNANPTQIYLGAIANERFTIRVKSALAFKGTVVAQTEATGGVPNVTSSWEVKGLIKQDADGNTVLVGSTQVVLNQDGGAAAWNAVFSADDANEALILTVTGAAGTTIHWAAYIDGVETVW